MEVADKNRTFESREADLKGHIGNPLGNDEVKGGLVDDNHAKAEEKKDKDKKDDEDLSSRRKPNPEKDDQLRKALELLKQPAQWQKSLGLAAKKPAPKKKKSDNDD